MFHTAARSHLTSSTNSFNTNSGIVYWEKTNISLSVSAAFQDFIIS